MPAGGEPGEVAAEIGAVVLVEEGEEREELVVHVGRSVLLPGGPTPGDHQRADQTRLSTGDPHVHGVVVVEPEEGGGIVWTGSGPLGHLPGVGVARAGGDGVVSSRIGPVATVNDSSAGTAADNSP